MIADFENEIIDRKELAKMTIEQLDERIDYKKWRMNNLYYIVNEQQQVVPFNFNLIQDRIWTE
jgi:hypothetical protein